MVTNSGREITATYDHKFMTDHGWVEMKEAYDYLNGLEETNVLPDELLREYQLDLLALQNKHIPAEICSSGKLIERIDEVTTLIDNVKWEVDSLNKSN